MLQTLHATNMECIQKGLAGIDMRIIGFAVLQISALPMVSQALKWRTRFWSFNIFLTEKAKAIVTACITMLVIACITMSHQCLHSTTCLHAAVLAYHYMPTCRKRPSDLRHEASSEAFSY
jgi:hypothetical protein